MKNIDVMPLLVQVQTLALDPLTSEETLRELLIQTLELIEKDQHIIESLQRIVEGNDKIIDSQEKMIEKASNYVDALQGVIVSQGC